ncbi:MAG: general secretion pathway protein GspB [Kiritimatiellaeota bacterium]|nr:general secretion pathway protein GspB [Kiritimatiellota bacterium]
MSLINEALKQAKANMAASAPPEAEERPPDETPPVSPIPPAPEVPGRRSSRTTDVLVGMLIFLLLALLLAAAAGGLYFIHSMRTSRPAPPTFGSGRPATEPATPVVKQSKTAGTVPKSTDSGQAESSAAETPAKPGPAPAARKPNPLARSLNRAKAIAETVHKRQMAPTEVVAANEKEPPVPDKAQKTAPSAVKSVQPAPANIIRTFKLTGIVEGPTGRLALINGAIVRQGRTIGNARIREIGNDFVIIEIKDRAYRVRIPGNTGF